MDAASEPEVGPAPPAPAAPGVPVVVDVNEPPDMVPLLEARGAVVERRRLAPADYVVGPIGIERKSVGDFHASIVSKRLFEQVTRLKETYPQAALLLEGDLSFIEERKHPRALWGALCSVAIDLDVAILPTPSREASADLLTVLARRVAREGYARGEGVRFKPRMLGPHAEQKFAVQGLPGIGDVVSENLLEHFGSVRRVYAAGEKDLLKVAGVGKLRARDVTEFLDRPWEGRQRRL